METRLRAETRVGSHSKMKKQAEVTVMTMRMKILKS